MTTEKQPARLSKETAAAHATARAEKLARRLGTVTAADVLSMTSAAGMDAIEQELDRAGSITLSLAFRLPGPDAPPVPESSHARERRLDKKALAFIAPAQTEKALALAEAARGNLSLHSIAQVALAIGLESIRQNGLAVGEVQFVPPAAPPLPDSAGEDFLPIRLTRAVAEKIRRMCEVADIDGGVDAFVSEIIGNTLEATAADVLIDCWNIEDPAIRAQLFALQAEAQEAANAAAAGNLPE